MMKYKCEKCGEYFDAYWLDKIAPKDEAMCRICYYKHIGKGHWIGTIVKETKIDTA